MIDTAAVIDGVLADLHADTRANLGFWTGVELIRSLDEALKRLSRLAAIFVLRDASTITEGGTAAYALPARHVATLHVSWGRVPLRPANMLELEGRDPAFESTPGQPTHWYEDLLAASKIALAAVPPTGLGGYGARELAMIYNSWPPEQDTAELNTQVLGPLPLKGYLAMAVLAAAYGAEGESEMPDVAEHCRGRMFLYEATFAQYYGKGL